ncbi:MAG: RagB/SusD family nutrient uptake outer membrane protein [Chitinophagaceae bacterium]|nr:RagB/SusD family nutrient uptake outer membrane protein [Chitinophagaceae bacterium]MCW5929418.1 RagB/SusD family nutrient uptake outer membrane protein [Chitinophagaceae bacterium]
MYLIKLIVTRNIQLGKLLLVFVIPVFFSCSKEIVNLNDPQNFNEGNYYSNMNECLESVAAIYSNLVDPGLDKYFFHAIDALGQEMSLLTGTEPTQPQFNNYNVDANNPINAWIWKSLFRHIWRASFALEKIEAWQPILESEEQQKKYMIGECRFFRAWSYYYLTQLYGDVPMHLTAGDIKSNPAKALTPVAEIGTTVIEPELLNAIEALPARWDNKYTGRITRGAAQTYLAKYYIGAGKFNEAITQLNNVINDAEAGYAYAADFYALFSNDDNRSNPEIIMQTIHDRSDAASLWFYFLIDLHEKAGKNSYNSKMNYYSRNDMSDFPLTDAAVSNANANQFVYILNGSSYIDPRASMTFYGGTNPDGTTLGATTYLGGTWPYTPYQEGASNTGYMLKKYMPFENVSMISSFGGNCGQNSTVWTRLTDVKLLLAEARLFSEDIPGAFHLINEVRTRPAIDADPYMTMFANADEAFRALIRERYVELSCEQQHWFDLRRWDRLGKIDMTAQIALESGKIMPAGAKTLPIPQAEKDTNPFID